MFSFLHVAGQLKRVGRMAAVSVSDILVAVGGISVSILLLCNVEMDKASWRLRRVFQGPIGSVFAAPVFPKSGLICVRFTICIRRDMWATHGGGLTNSVPNSGC